MRVWDAAAQQVCDDCLLPAAHAKLERDDVRLLLLGRDLDDGVETAAMLEPGPAGSVRQLAQHQQAVPRQQQVAEGGGAGQSHQGRTGEDIHAALPREGGGGKRVDPPREDGGGGGGGYRSTEGGWGRGRGRL